MAKYKIKSKHKLTQNSKIQRAIKAMAKNALNYGIKKYNKTVKTPKPYTSPAMNKKRKEIVERMIKIKSNNLILIEKRLFALCIKIGEDLIRKKMAYYSKHQVLNKYTPIIYKRRNGGIGDRSNFYVRMFIFDEERKELQVEFRDYTPPSRPLFGSLTSTDVYLAEWISAVEWNEIELDYEYLPEGIIPNIWATIKGNEVDETPIWAAPNYRPYLRMVQEYIRSERFTNDILKNSLYQQLLKEKQQIATELAQYEQELAQYNVKTSKSKKKK